MNETVFETFPNLRTERFLLREVTDADLQMVFDFNASIEALRYVPRAPYRKLDEAIEKIEGFRKGFAERKGIWWTFETKEGGEAIGYGGLFDIDAGSSKAEIGYGLLEPFWGHGYASDAAAAMTRFGVCELGLHRIYGQVDPANPPSARVLLKLGYVHEGCLRDDVFARNRYFDMDIFALVTPDNLP